MNKTNTSTIIIFTALVVVASSMILIPTVDNQVHGLIFKDDSGKVKSFVKNEIRKIFNRGGDGSCQTCP